MDNGPEAEDRDCALDKRAAPEVRLQTRKTRRPSRRKREFVMIFLWDDASRTKHGNQRQDDGTILTDLGDEALMEGFGSTNCNDLKRKEFYLQKVLYGILFFSLWLLITMRATALLFDARNLDSRVPSFCLFSTNRLKKSDYLPYLSPGIIHMPRIHFEKCFVDMT